MPDPNVLPDGRYYTTQEYLLARYDALARQLGMRATTLAAYEIWRQELRARLREITGLDTMLSCAPEPRLTERVELEDHVRERVVLQTEPGVWMPLYVLLPRGLRPGEQRPAIIAAHGHGFGSKFGVAGRWDLVELRERLQRYHGDYGLQLVRQGYVVFCPDARGFGERREGPRQGDDFAHFIPSSCEILNHMAMPLGQTVTGMWVWDLMRLADYVATRPECDAARLGCVGLSGGGWQTLWLAALDERVRCAVVSGYFFGSKDSLLRTGGIHCSCHHVPGLWTLADVGDIGALVAPRPLLIESGTEDTLSGERGMANITEQLDITRTAYQLYGAPERLAHAVFRGPHQWHGAQAIPWLAQHL